MRLSKLTLFKRLSAFKFNVVLEIKTRITSAKLLISMLKSASRIKAFVNLTKKNGKFSIDQVTPLFEKLVRNVRHEYKKFHYNREPKINNLEIAAVDSIEPWNQAAYLQDTKFTDIFVKFKEQQELPFSITQEIKSDSQYEDASVFFPSQEILRTSYFVSNSFSRESFYQIQRMHKIWWMRFGASPGKYSISDQKSESIFKYVNIMSSASGSPMSIERIRLFSLKDCIKDKECLSKYHSRAPNRKKETVPDIVETDFDLQLAALSLLLDAVHLSDECTYLHRRSAPYQLALISNGSSTDVIKLTKYIELLIQATDEKIGILNEPHSIDSNQEEHFKMCDKIGVPYTIIVDEESLNSGFLKLRNRNTTLSETIHLSDVTNYVIKIFSSG